MDDPLISELQRRRDAALDTARAACGRNDLDGENRFLSSLYSAQLAQAYIDMLQRVGQEAVAT
jgi:hypothetical protein